MVAELRPSHLLLAAVLCLAAATTARAADQPETAASKQNVKDFLDAHNEVRKKYGLPPLVWDKEVSRAAHHHGNVLIKTCTMYHSENNKYGENLFLGEVAEQWDPIKIVYSWANESLWWDRGTLGCAKGPDACGHFTQIVWYDTQRLGCKMLKCVDKPGVIGICEYDPPGNYAKEDPLVSHKEKRDRETKPSTGGQAPAPSASQAAPPPEPTQDQAAPPPEPTQGQAPPPPEPTQSQAPPPPEPTQGQAPPPPEPTQGQAPPPPEPTQGQAPPPPEQAQAPPDQTQTPPAQGQASSEQTQAPPAQGQASSEQTQTPPAQGQASSEQTQTPAAQGQATPGQAQAPPEQNQVQAVQSQVVQSQVNGQGQDMQSQVQDMQKQMQEQVQKQVQDIQNQMQTPGVQVVTSVHPTMQMMPSVHQ